MTVRLRFLLFFLSGVAVALIPVAVFLIAGILEVSDVLMRDVLVLGIGLSIISLAASTTALIIMLKKFGRPVAALVEGVERISRGDLSFDLPDDAPAEFGTIKKALDGMCGQMRMVLSQLNELSKRVEQSTTGAGKSSNEVHREIEVQSDIAARAFNEIEDLKRVLTEASEGVVESVTRRVDATVSKVSQINASISHFADVVEALNTSVIKATEKTETGDKRARALVKNMSLLSQSVNTAKGVLAEMMERSLRARSEAGDAAFIVGNLESGTERIGAAIEDVIRGSDAAHASNERILEVTANLQSRVNRVDDVIEVIGNLAERTKLLSINASIIASEAGEHGRAFAVVASEIKDLAQSTKIAVQEVSNVVMGLKQGFGQTVEAIQRGQEEVDQGVKLARNAVALLGSIPEEVRKAASSNSEIVIKTDLQIERGTYLHKLMENSGITLDQVAQLLTEQVSSNEVILKMFQDINMVGEQVSKSTESYAATTGDLALNIEAINRDFRLISEQMSTCVSKLDNLFKLSADVLSITDSNRQRAAGLVQLISDLNRFALYLGEDFRKLDKKRESKHT
jgi:methyl-accepting chemotaxis protein